MRKYLPLLLILVLFSCKTKTETSYGHLIPLKDGFVLPMSKAPGEKDITYEVSLIFGDNALFITSKKPLKTCYISFAHDTDNGQKDIINIDLDFIDVLKGRYVYSTPYTWFPSKTVLLNTFQTAVYYAPDDVMIPTKEFTEEDGAKVLYPDFSGYMYLFDKEETAEWFRPMIETLR